MENNYEIFKELKPNENVIISNYQGYDLVDLLRLLNGYYLEYRNRLSFNNKVSIGCEIEYENPLKEELAPVKDDEVEIRPGWLLVEDGTLDNGGEIVSPIFYNNSSSWKDLKETCELLDGNVTINDNCGGHVHIGAHFMGDNPRTWNNFLRLWSSYENVIYRFAFGEFLNARSNLYRYATPIANEIDTYFSKIQKQYGRYVNFDNIMPFKEYEFQKSLSTRKYHGINLCHVLDYNQLEKNNTIEFRAANGTISHIIWQNLINLYINLMRYSKSDNFDLDTVLRRKNDKVIKYLKPYDFTNLYIDQAIELADLIFNKNIDKIYFLRQYLKDSEKSFHYELVKSQKFTV